MLAHNVFGIVTGGTQSTLGSGGIFDKGKCTFFMEKRAKYY